MREKYDPCKVKCLEDQIEDLNGIGIDNDRKIENNEGEVIEVTLPTEDSE